MPGDATVFVVDDHEPLRAAVQDLLVSVGMRVETYASAAEFLAAHDSSRRGCLVLDIRMPETDGLELQQTLKCRGIDIPIVFLTGHGDVPMAVQAMSAGAVGFIEKPFREQELLDHIKTAIRVDAERRQASSQRAEMERRLTSLTAREQEVLAGVLAGKTSKIVALELGLSRKTIDQHRARVMSKLAADNVVELVKLVSGVRGR
jgi:FixJ family two-component response regulator